MARCEAMTITGRCRLWARDDDDSCLCRVHRYYLRIGVAVRLTGNRQARIAYDINGSNPQVRLAPVGDDNRQGITA